MRADDQQSHCKSVCGRRQTVCPMCKAGLQQCALETHQASECPQRLVPCSKGCGRKLRVPNAKSHEDGCSGTLPLCSIAG
jgi:hypothetical protein